MYVYGESYHSYRCSYTSCNDADCEINFSQDALIPYVQCLQGHRHLVSGSDRLKLVCSPPCHSPRELIILPDDHVADVHGIRAQSGRAQLDCVPHGSPELIALYWHFTTVRYLRRQDHNCDEDWQDYVSTWNHIGCDDVDVLPQPTVGASCSFDDELLLYMQYKLTKGVCHCML